MLASTAPAASIAGPVSVAKSAPQRESDNSRDTGPRRTASALRRSRGWCRRPPCHCRPGAIINNPAAEKAVLVRSPVSFLRRRREPAKAAFGCCGQEPEHVNCVADGSTFWYKGEKIVIADIVNPGIDNARCDGERRASFAASSGCSIY